MSRPDGAERFFTGVWSADGAHFLVSPRKNGRGFEHFVVSGLDAAIEKIDELKQHERDVYFAPASFNEGGGRTGENSLGARCFWLDVDCGVEKAAKGDGYATKTDAWEPLKKFCTDTGLPQPNGVVESGNGLHLYWLVSEFVNRSLWLDIAAKLKKLLKQHGFLADPSRTADIASLLRVPGTLNYKNPEAPKPVVLKRLSATTIELSDLERCLESITVAPLQRNVSSSSGNNVFANALPDESFQLQDIIHEGTRENQLIGFAGQLRSQGAPESIILGFVREVNRARCKPPLEDERVFSLCERYKDQNKSLVVEGLAARHFVFKHGGVVYVGDRQDDDILGNAMSFQAFQQFTSGRENGARDAKEFLNSPTRPTFDGVTFDPNRKDTGSLLNLYKGLAVQPRQGDCSLILAHIEQVWCSGNDEQYQYVIKWLALLVQQPWIKPGVALVLRSKEGAGKTIIADVLLSFWGQHGFTAASKEQVAGRFNAHLLHKVLIVLEEAFFAGDPAAVASTKALITNTQIGYEPKGKAAFTGNNFAHVISLTNNEWAVPAGGDARRWMVFDVSDCRKGDTAYFKALVAQINTGGREAFLHYLLNVDVEGWNPSELPTSSALHGQKVQTLIKTNPVAGWLLHVLSEGCFSVPGGDVEWGEEISAADMQESYIESTKRIRNAPAWDLAAKNVREYMPSRTLRKVRKSVGGGRYTSYLLPELGDARAEFERKTGINPCKA